MKRKPQAKQTAHEALNAFLKIKNIALGLSKPEISFTNSNQIVINPSQIIAVYVDEKKEVASA